MTFQTRVAIYLLAIFVGGLVNLVVQYQVSLQASKTDPSAMAAWGFVVFFFPLFWILPTLVVGPAAVLTEVVLFAWRKWVE